MGLLVGSPVQGKTPEAKPAPLVVADDAISGATAATSARSMLRVDQTGLYRITFLLFCTTGGDAITLQPNAVYTDRVGAVTLAVGTAFSLNATGRTSMSALIEANKGTTISWSTTLSGARVASVHAVEVVLERMEAL